MLFTVHVITNGDPSRIEQTSNALKEYDLSYEIHTIPRHPTDGRLGCFLSHIQLYEYAKKNDMNWIVIAEDNLITHPKSDAKHLQSVRQLHHVYEWIDKNEWEIIYLGGWVKPFIRYTKTSMPWLYGTHSTHGTSFYIIHKRFYERVLETYQKHTSEHIDDFMNSIAHQPFVLVPFVGYRNPYLNTTNRYFDTPWINDLLSRFHTCYRQPPIMRLLQSCAAHATELLFLVCCLTCIYVYVLRTKS